MAAVATVVVCCAGPVLLGALGVGISSAAVGAFFGKPLMITTAVVLVAVATALIVLRYRRRQ